MPAGNRIVPALAGAGTLEGPMQFLKIDLDGLRYKSGHFSIRSSTVENAVWQFMLRPENVIRMEAVTAVERPAVEALSRPLVWEFGRDIAQPCIKQMVGHMARQIMEALEYEVDRHRVRITRPGLFTTGMTFRLPGQPRSRSVIVTAEHRREWLNNAETGPFNFWLDGVIAEAVGTTDVERLRRVATDSDAKLRGRSPSLDRIELGIILRERIAPAEYESSRTRKRAADADDAKRLETEAQYIRHVGQISPADVLASGKARSPG
jgi:hypothetical protein